MSLDSLTPASNASDNQSRPATPPENPVTGIPDPNILQRTLMTKVCTLPPKSRGRTLAVGIALIGHIDTPSGRCSPTVAMLVKDTAYDERTVRRALKDLQRIGFIADSRKCAPAGGQFPRNSYTLMQARGDSGSGEETR